MNVFELTRALVDIESITENESEVGLFLLDHLGRLAAQTGGRVERMAGRRRPVPAMLASWGNPAVTLSTHMDTVPSVSCVERRCGDCPGARIVLTQKGIIASMIGQQRKSCWTKA